MLRRWLRLHESARRRWRRRGGARMRLHSGCQRRAKSRPRSRRARCACAARRRTRCGSRQGDAKFRTPARSRRHSRSGTHDDGSRRMDKDRNSRGGRDRQRKTFARRRRRWQHDEFAGPRRQEEHRRPRRRPEAKSAEHNEWTIDVAHLIGRRRRHAEIDHGEVGWRFHLGAQKRQPPACVPHMRAVRISPQIGPIGRRRIVHHAVTPGDLLAAHRDHRRDAL